MQEISKPSLNGFIILPQSKFSIERSGKRAKKNMLSYSHNLENDTFTIVGD